jgi:LacI family transcriptional regulator, galactose operon repressor
VAPTVTNIGKRRRRPRWAQATLTDVARAAAVSTASASRALTRPEAVSDQLRMKVSESAKALGYVPNSAARALACRRSGLVGVVTGDFDEPGMAPALAALDARLSDAGRALLLCSGGKDRTPLAGARALVTRDVEALVFLGVDLPTDLREVRGIQRLPCVSTDRTDRTGFTASAGLDLGRAGKLIAAYLGQLGHRCMGVVAEAHSVLGALVVDALRSNALEGSSLEVLNIGDEPVAEGILRWLALPNSPTAAICLSDATALAVMHACACHGIDVPGRLSVVGFGDTAFARCVSPMLTSVRIPARAAGIAAAEYLLARFAGRVSDLAELPVKLAIRGSTGPPARSLRDV